jgi:hypothetical protein
MFEEVMNAEVSPFDSQHCDEFEISPFDSQLKIITHSSTVRLSYLGYY